MTLKMKWSHKALWQWSHCFEGNSCIIQPILDTRKDIKYYIDVFILAIKKLNLFFNKCWKILL